MASSKFVPGVNRRTRELYCVEAESTSPYSRPSDLVLPRTLWLSSDDFFGDHKTDEIRRERHRRRFSQHSSYEQGPGFDFDNLFADSSSSSGYHIIIVGPAGSGKTTIVQRYLLHKLKQDDGTRIYIGMKANQFRNYKNKEENEKEEGKKEENEVEIHKFLLQGQDEVNTGVVFKWMLENPRFVTFFIDALDTLPFSLAESRKYESADLRDKEHARPSDILLALFRRTLLKGCQILTSSREYAIVDSEEILHADKIIVLRGFSDKAIGQVSLRRLGEKKSEKFIEKVKREYSDLWFLCSMPIFLSFALMQYELCEKGGDDLPASFSGMMCHLLENFIRSENWKVGKKNSGIFQKLKLLAYKGALDKKYTFSHEDFRELGIDIKCASNLTICEMKLFKGAEGAQYFSHQSFQEALAALHVLDMDKENFNDYVDDQMHEKDFLLIRRFISGFLLNAEVHRAFQDLEFCKDVDTPWKRDQVSASLSRQLRKEREKVLRLELFIAIHEAGSVGKKIVEQAKLDTVNLAGERMNPSDMHIVGSVISHLEFLKCVNFANCRIEDAGIHAFHQAIGNSNVQVAKFCLEDNFKITKRTTPKLGELAKSFKLKVLSLKGCEITDTELSGFTSSLDRYDLEELSLAETTEVDVTRELVQAICKILPRVQKTLDLEGWDLDQESERLLHKTLQNLKEKDCQVRTVIKHGRDETKTTEGVRLEDCFNTVAKRFYMKGSMQEFALSATGLRLPFYKVQNVETDNQSGAHAGRIKLLELWKEINGPDATAAALETLVDNYFKELIDQD